VTDSREDDVSALRGALYRRDGSIVSLLQGQLHSGNLQLAGDGLRVALATRERGAHELALKCIEMLNERWWDGDEELVQQLRVALGDAEQPSLAPITVDLEQLASLLEGDPLLGGGRVDLRSGDCWPREIYENLDDSPEDADADYWLYFEPHGSRGGYADMQLFISTVTDPVIADRLEIAISGRGAFRRFKDVLSRWPDEFHRYILLTTERQRGRARAALVELGYAPLPPGVEL
jgi:hypothetical protein